MFVFSVEFVILVYVFVIVCWVFVILYILFCVIWFVFVVNVRLIVFLNFEILGVK